MTVWSCFLFFIYLCSIKNDQSVINMEKEKFESVHKTFNYTPKSVFTNQLSSLAFGIGMIVIPAIYPFGIRIRRAEILSPAVFSTILIIGGVLLLVLTFFNMRKARALIAQGGTIKIDGGRVTYPVIKGGKVEYDSFLVSDINYIKDDDEENQCKVSLPDKYIVFETKYFDSWKQFEEFRSLIG